MSLPPSRLPEASVRQAPLALSTMVSEALAAGKAVVALETAVATHGLPHPQNLEAMAAMTAAVERNGAVPAVCVVHTGRIVIGASHDSIEAVVSDPDCEKAGSRDLGRVVALRRSAGLTVSACLAVARAAGIRVFATGGIGGVHRDFERTGDVSADLGALADSPVITVCSGAKSILDIPRTLEHLETLGVPVLGYRTHCFPAFYLRDSGMRVPPAASASDLAQLATVHWDLGLRSGVVVGNPIPDADAISPEDWEEWLMRAQTEARGAGVSGGSVTPYLLSRVADLSGGRTVSANMSLLRANAALAAQIAAALAG